MFFPNSLQTMEAKAVRGELVGTESLDSDGRGGDVCVNAPCVNAACVDATRVAAETGAPAMTDRTPDPTPDLRIVRAAESAIRDEVERIIESDPDLIPTAPSQLLVAPLVLERAEVEALLDGLSPLLEIS